MGSLILNDLVARVSSGSQRAIAASRHSQATVGGSVGEGDVPCEKGVVGVGGWAGEQSIRLWAGYLAGIEARASIGPHCPTQRLGWQQTSLSVPVPPCAGLTPG